jgi:putative transcriptional regulator
VAELAPGSLLVATPRLNDPNFVRTVVLLCSVDPAGAMGVVLNRPAEEASVSQFLPAWREQAREPAVMFRGGPVEPTAGIGVGVVGPDGPPANWTAITPSLGLIDLSSEPDPARPLRSVRVFVGYAGWTADQLQGEVDEDAWFVVDGLAEDAIDKEPATLWRRVLRRQRTTAAMFAFYTDDPRVN